MLNYLRKNFLQQRHLVLISKLSVAECQERLRARTLPDASMSMWTKERKTPIEQQPMVSHITAWGFSFFKREAVYSGRGVIFRANGHLEAIPSGTRIHLTLGVPDWTAIVTVGMFWPVPVLVAIFAPFLFPFLLLLLFGAFILGRDQGRKEDAFLERFIRETLQVEERTSDERSA